MTSLHRLPHEALRIPRRLQHAARRSFDGIRRAPVSTESASIDQPWVRPQPVARRPSYNWLWYASRTFVVMLCFAAGIALHSVTVGSTQSMFYDSDELPHSILGTTALDVAVHTNGSSELSLPQVDPGARARAGLDIVIDATTSAPFTYTLAAENREGACDAFSVETSINGTPVFNGPLANLSLTPPHAAEGSDTHDLVNLIFSTPQQTTDTHCTFDLKIIATNGFTDTETISITLNLPGVISQLKSLSDENVEM